MKLFSTLRAPFLFYRQSTGQSLGLWMILAIAACDVQIIFRRTLDVGHFGTLQTVLGLIGLLTVPFVALSQALTQYFVHDHGPEHSQRLAGLRASSLFLTDTLGLILAVLSVPAFFIIMPIFSLRGLQLQVCTILTFLVTLGALVGAEVYRNNLNRWTRLLLGAAVARILLAYGLTHYFTTAYTAFTVLITAGFVTLIAALDQRETGRDFARLWQAVRDRDFLLHLAATFCVVFGIYVFTNADRIVSQDWFGNPVNNNIGYVNWPRFDAYQSAGLLGRGLLWGTMPLLLLVYVERTHLTRTTFRSMRFFWVYLATLIVSAILLGTFSGFFSYLFCGRHFEETAHFLPAFCLAMVPLGILQGVGIFALASHRYPECFTFAGASLFYSIPLFLEGRQPEIMLLYMFVGATVALMIIMFVGVVRWGRKQP